MGTLEADVPREEADLGGDLFDGDSLEAERRAVVVVLERRVEGHVEERARAVGRHDGAELCVISVEIGARDHNFATRRPAMQLFGTVQHEVRAATGRRVG